MKKILPLALLLTACQAELDKDKLDATIQQQLHNGPYQSAAFLTLKYGDSRPVVATKLKQLRDAGTVASIEPDSEGEHPLASEASGFKMSTPWALKDLKWNVGTHYHNDSLTEVHLFTFIRDSDPSLEYNALAEKYKEVYGLPAASTAKQSVFVKGSQYVELDLSESMIQVIYKNTALDKRVFNQLTKCHFDKMGNTYDSAYYKQIIEPRKPANPDKI